MVSSAFAQEQRLRTLSVTGQGIERIETTLAQVSLAVEIEAETAVEAQQEVAQQSAAVVDLLRSRNVERLQTTGINLRPNYSYSDDEQRIISYSAFNQVSFQADVEDVGALLDEAVEVGATQISGISFTAEEEAIATAQRQALRRATEDARAQADAVLDALNLSAQDIVNIQINNASQPPAPVVVMETQALRSDRATTPVVGGEQDINASVTLHIQY